MLSPKWMARAARFVDMLIMGVVLAAAVILWRWYQEGGGFEAVYVAIGVALSALFLARRRLTLLEVYERGYQLEEPYQLAEQMLTWDERTIIWRFHHLKVVERIIGGNVIGTQGTPVEVLSKRIDVKFFPELWLVRDEITRRSKLGADGHGMDHERR